jgi:hypothetical protein
MRALVLFCNDAFTSSNPPDDSLLSTLLLKTEPRFVTFTTRECLGMLPIWTNEFLLSKQKHSLPSYGCFMGTKTNSSRSQWPRGLRRGSAAARLLRLWVQIPGVGHVCLLCCVLSGRGLCDKLITRPEESYRLWCVVVCDLETSRMRSWPTLGCSPQGVKN